MGSLWVVCDVMVNRGPRSLLNSIKWDFRYDFGLVEVFYFHRGAPDNMRSIWGRDMKGLGKSFMETSRGMIPYHRILKIVYKGRVLFEKV